MRVGTRSSSRRNTTRPTRFQNDEEEEDHNDHNDSNHDNDNDDGEWEAGGAEQEANDAWAKEAALYDSSLEEEEECSEEEYDEDDVYSGDEEGMTMDMDMDIDDDDDEDRVGWESIQHTTTKGVKRKKGKGAKGKKKKGRTSFPKARQTRTDVIPLSPLTPDQKRHALNIIQCKDNEQWVQGVKQPGLLLVWKFTQALLWDMDFRYNLLPHQYEGTLAVAGVDESHLCQSLSQWIQADESQSSETLLHPEEIGIIARRNIIANESMKLVDTKGLLLADDMGLGKTIQGLAGAILRQGIQSIKSDRQRAAALPVLSIANTNANVPATATGSNKKNGKDKEDKIVKNLPCGIVAPNKDVLDQWEETLLKSGVPPERIHYFHPLRRIADEGDTFVLLTRYELFTEMRNFMEYKTSNLYPHMSVGLLNMLRDQYLSGQGKKRNKWREKEETDSECTTRLLQRNVHQFTRCIFRTILIDEAHFLKNLLSYWGIGTALLGMVSERSIPLSGTPYNNGTQDMATLMTFIDPCKGFSKSYWWEQATEGKGDYVRKKVSEWRREYVIRRDKTVLTVKLPKKIIEAHPVASFRSELQVYNYYEGTFMKALKDFSSIGNVVTPAAKMRQKELFTILMATMACMRMCLIHPLIPGGREYTVRFSPTRRSCRKLIGSMKKANSNTCVCCSMHLSEKVKWKETGVKREEGLSKEELKALVDITGGGAVVDDEQMQNADFDGGGGGGNANAARRRRGQKKTKKKKQKVQEFVEVPSEYCRAGACEGVPHYIHKECLQKRKDDPEPWTCPRCDDLENRVMVNRQARVKRQDDAGGDDNSRPIYCEHVVCGGEKGIQANAKLYEVVQWAQSLPVGDKAILYSFFKGGLDLLEGILVEHLGIECARFDGDISPADRSKELDRFKKSSSCRILLASVQSCGVGLNIVEANHVAFLDRWFNPSVHSQAEDRCHRLRQTKEVQVKYFDTYMTVDEVMAYINNVKKNNATVLLADGSDMGASQNGIKYRDLAGAIGQMMKTVSSERRMYDALHPGKAYEPISESSLSGALDETEAINIAKGKEESIKAKIERDEVEEKMKVKVKPDPNPDRKVKIKTDAKPERITSTSPAQQNPSESKISSTSSLSSTIKADDVKSSSSSLSSNMQTAPDNPTTTIKTSRRKRTFLLPLKAGEYEVSVPVTSDGMLLKINCNAKMGTHFTGYRACADGSKGPSETRKLIKKVGDRIIGFNGVDTENMSFQEVISLMKEATINKLPVLMRLRNHLHTPKKESESFFNNLSMDLDDLTDDDDDDEMEEEVESLAITVETPPFQKQTSTTVKLDTPTKPITPSTQPTSNISSTSPLSISKSLSKISSISTLPSSISGIDAQSLSNMVSISPLSSSINRNGAKNSSQMSSISPSSSINGNDEKSLSTMFSISPPPSSINRNGEKSSSQISPISPLSSLMNGNDAKTSSSSILPTTSDNLTASSNTSNQRRPLLSPLKSGEYEALVPITSDGMLLSISSSATKGIHFSGYRAFPDGSKGPAETRQLIKNVGDKIIGFNGVDTENMRFPELVSFIKVATADKLQVRMRLRNHLHMSSKKPESFLNNLSIDLDGLKDNGEVEIDSPNTTTAPPLIVGQVHQNIHCPLLSDKTLGVSEQEHQISEESDDDDDSVIIDLT